MKINNEEFRRMLQEKGLTVTNFARIIQMERSVVSGILNNKRNPGGKFIGAFMKSFPTADIRLFFKT